MRSSPSRTAAPISGVPISGGRLVGGEITCGAHHWQYDAATGCGVNPRSAALRRFPARVRDGAVEVDVEPDAGGAP